MSLLPLLFNDWWEDLDHPHRLFDQNFGHALTFDDLSLPKLYGPGYSQAMLPRSKRYMPTHSIYYRPWNELVRKSEGGGTSTVKADKDKFQVVLDVQQFKPDEINVKVVDRFVVVEGKHEEKQDEHGTISRHFVRKYMIPEQCDIEQVSSSLSSDGVLTLMAPRKDVPKVTNEKAIKIMHTGKPAIQADEGQKKVEANSEKCEKK